MRSCRSTNGHSRARFHWTGAFSSAVGSAVLAVVSLSLSEKSMHAGLCWTCPGTRTGEGTVEKAPDKRKMHAIATIRSIAQNTDLAPLCSGRANGSTPDASHHTPTVSYVSQFPPAVPVVSFRLPARLTPGDYCRERYVRRRSGDAVAAPQCSFCGTLCAALFSRPFTT